MIKLTREMTTSMNPYTREATEGDMDIIQSLGYIHSCHHYVCYLVIDMFLDSVRVIQGWYKRRHFQRKLARHLHCKKFSECVKDLFELGFTPPMYDIPLYAKGGYMYREAKQSYTDCQDSIGFKR